jgi:protein tyrosine phosphatase
MPANVQKKLRSEQVRLRNHFYCLFSRGLYDILLDTQNPERNLIDYLRISPRKRQKCLFSLFNFRYANVIPLPETRVHLSRLDDDEKTEYINANFVKVSYYIFQQPLFSLTTPYF